MRVVLQGVRGNTNIKMERNMSREHLNKPGVCSSGHLVMKNTWISSNEGLLSVGRRIQSTNGRTAMMRASGRSIPRKCDAREHDF